MCSAPHPQKDPENLHPCCSPVRGGDVRELSFDSAGGGNSAVLRQDTHPALQPLSEMHIMSSCFSAFPPTHHPPHPLRRIALCRGRSGQLNPQRNSQDKCPGVPEVRWVAAARRLCTLNLFNKNIPLHLCKSLICFSDHSTDPVI